MVAMLEAYMDESGTHDGSPVLTVGAYLAGPEDWRDWTAEWDAAKGAIKIYHATDAAALRGEFERWTKDDVAVLASRLLPIIARAPLGGVVVGIHLFSFEKAMAGRDDLRQIFGTPYMACFQWVVQTILNIQGETKNREPISFIHECNQYQHEALQAFNFVRDRENPRNAIIGLRFGDKASGASHLK